jgi:hypothetical protein
MTTALDVLMPTLGGVVFFFLIIGVSGFWVAIGGLVFAVVLALTIFVRSPMQRWVRDDSESSYARTCAVRVYREFHIIFPTMSIGLASFLAVVEGLWLKTKDDIFLQIYRFWLSIFAMGFGVGVVTGIVHPFEFGLGFGTVVGRH